jgi:hypothetical protein
MRNRYVNIQTPLHCQVWPVVFMVVVIADWQEPIGLGLDAVKWAEKGDICKYWQYLPSFAHLLR